MQQPSASQIGDLVGGTGVQCSETAYAIINMYSANLKATYDDGTITHIECILDKNATYYPEVASYIKNIMVGNIMVINTLHADLNVGIAMLAFIRLLTMCDCTSSERQNLLATWVKVYNVVTNGAAKNHIMPPHGLIFAHIFSLQQTNYTLKYGYGVILNTILPFLKTNHFI